MKSNEVSSEQEFWDFFAEVLEVDHTDSLTFSTNITAIEEWDSLVLLTFMSLATQRFSVQLDGSKIKDATTVGELYNLVFPNS